MKKTYDWNEDTITCTCPVCGYKHTKEMNYTQKTIEGDETFIKMENIELNSTDRSYYYPSHNTHTIYACPKCGVLQIEI